MVFGFRRRRRAVTAGLALSTFVMFGAGCGGYKYRQSIDTITQPYHAGIYDVAADKAVKVTAESNERDRLVLLLEEGTALRAAGKLDASNRAFDQADKLFEKYDAKAKTRLDREAIATLASPAFVDYEGYGYDRIMMNVYKALNDLEGRKGGDARVEVTRIADSQAKCEQRYQDKIAQSERALKDEKQSPDTEARVRKDKKFNQDQTVVLSEFPEVAGETPIENQKHKALYSNPFAEYLQGVYYLSSDAPGDREIGRVAFRNAAGMVPRNKVIAQDVADAEAAANGAYKPRTYVFFETGMAPKRDEIRIDIPVFVFNVAVKDTKVDYVGIAFPKLTRDNRPWDRDVTVNTVDGSWRSESLADVDEIVAREFKNEMPWVITRAVISAAAKAAAQYAVAEGTKKQSELVQFVSRAAVAGYSAATNEADLRTWRTLPKRVEVASCATPADGKATLRFGNSAQPWAVQVTPGKANVIWVRRPNASARPEIRSFTVN
jgi:hypothetical protein